MKHVERLLARWLKRRGWVVFWLDEPARFCVPSDKDHVIRRPGEHQGCWLAIYEAERKAGR